MKMDGYDSNGVGIINSGDEEWVSKLGEAFALGEDGTEIPKLVWESKVNI